MKRRHFAALLAALLALLVLLPLAPRTTTVQPPNVPYNAWTAVSVSIDYGAYASRTGKSVAMSLYSNQTYDRTLERIVYMALYTDTGPGTPHTPYIYANAILKLDAATLTVTVMKVQNWSCTGGGPDCAALSEDATDPTPSPRHNSIVAMNNCDVYLGGGLNNKIFGAGAVHPQDTWTGNLCAASGASNWWTKRTTNQSSDPPFSATCAILPRVSFSHTQDKVLAYLYMQANCGSRATARYNPATNAHTFASSTTPGTQWEAYGGAQQAWRDVDDCHYLFGANVAGNSLHRYCESSGAWVALNYTGATPSGRGSATFVYNKKLDRFILTGGSSNGEGSGTKRQDTFAYCPPDICGGDGVMTDITSTVGQLPLHGGWVQGAYDEENDVLLVETYQTGWYALRYLPTCGQQTIIDAAWPSYTPQNGALPTLAATTTDPMFGSCVTRITDHNVSTGLEAVHIYSEIPFCNITTTVCVLQNRTLLDGPTSTVCGSCANGGVVPSGMDSLRWSATQANILYARRNDKEFVSYNVLTGATAVVHTAAELFIGKDASHQPVAASGGVEYVVLVTCNTSNCSGASSGKIYVLNITAGTAGTKMDLSSAFPDYAGMLPDVSGVLVNWGVNGTGATQGQRTYDLSMNSVGQVTSRRAHSAVSTDSAGAVQLTTADDSGTLPIVIRCPLSLSGCANLKTLAEHGGYHFSRLDGQSWSLLTTFVSSGSTPPEAIRVYDDSSDGTPHLERLLHTRTDVPYVAANCSHPASYWVQPHGSLISPTKFVFGSNYHVTGQGTGTNCRAMAFIADVPAPAGVSTPVLRSPYRLAEAQQRKKVSLRGAR